MITGTRALLMRFGKTSAIFWSDHFATISFLAATNCIEWIFAPCWLITLKKILS